jgi:hypothetical protein
MQSRNILSRKNKRKFGKSKTRKGGLGKNGYPGGLVVHTEQSRQKLGKQIKEGMRLQDQGEYGANFRNI